MSQLPVYHVGHSLNSLGSRAEQGVFPLSTLSALPPTQPKDQPHTGLPQTVPAFLGVQQATETIQLEVDVAPQYASQQFMRESLYKCQETTMASLRGYTHQQHIITGQHDQQQQPLTAYQRQMLAERAERARQLQQQGSPGLTSGGTQQAPQSAAPQLSQHGVSLVGVMTTEHVKPPPQSLEPQAYSHSGISGVELHPVAPHHLIASSQQQRPQLLAYMQRTQQVYHQHQQPQVAGFFHEGPPPPPPPPPRESGRPPPNPVFGTNTLASQQQHPPASAAPAAASSGPMSQPDDLEQHAFHLMTSEQQAAYMEQWQQYYLQQQYYQDGHYYGQQGGREATAHYYQQQQSYGQYGNQDLGQFYGAYGAKPPYDQAYAQQTCGQARMCAGPEQQPYSGGAPSSSHPPPHPPPYTTHAADTLRTLPTVCQELAAAASGAAAQLGPGAAAPPAGSSGGGKRIPDWLREEMLKRQLAAAAGPSKGTASDEEQEDDGGGSGGGGRWGDPPHPHEAAGGQSDQEDAEEQSLVRREVVNREIKVNLTQILLDVTDALFAEVAREVYSEAAPTRRSRQEGAVKLASEVSLGSAGAQDGEGSSGVLGLGYRSDEEEDDTGEGDGDVAAKATGGLTQGQGPDPGVDPAEAHRGPGQGAAAEAAAAAGHGGAAVGRGSEVGSAVRRESELPPGRDRPKMQPCCRQVAAAALDSNRYLESGRAAGGPAQGATGAALEPLFRKGQSVLLIHPGSRVPAKVLAALPAAAHPAAPASPARYLLVADGRKVEAEAGQLAPLQDPLHPHHQAQTREQAAQDGGGRAAALAAGGSRDPAAGAQQPVAAATAAGTAGARLAGGYEGFLSAETPQGETPSGAACGHQAPNALDDAVTKRAAGGEGGARRVDVAKGTRRSSRSPSPSWKSRDEIHEKRNRRKQSRSRSRSRTRRDSPRARQHGSRRERDRDDDQGRGRGRGAGGSRRPHSPRSCSRSSESRHRGRSPRNSREGERNHRRRGRSVGRPRSGSRADSRALGQGGGGTSEARRGVRDDREGGQERAGKRELDKRRSAGRPGYDREAGSDSDSRDHTGPRRAGREYNCKDGARDKARRK